MDADPCKVACASPVDTDKVRDDEGTIASDISTLFIKSSYIKKNLFHFCHLHQLNISIGLIKKHL